VHTKRCIVIVYANKDLRIMICAAKFIMQTRHNMKVQDPLSETTVILRSSRIP